MAKKNVQIGNMSDLRNRAQDFLAQKKDNVPAMSPDGIQKLVHELDTYQIELELQNEDLRQVQEELDKSRKRFSDLFDFAPVGYLTISDKGLIIECNLTAAEMIGEERGYMLRQPPTRFIVDEDQDIYYLSKNNLLETKEIQTCEFRMQKKDGSQFGVQCKHVIEPGIDGNTGQFRMVIIDISYQIAAQQEQKRLESELHQAHKMEAIGLMAAGIAHDLNNILSGITGYPELLLLDLPPESNLRIPLTEILKSGRRAADVVDELLTMVRGVAIAKEPHDCKGLIEQFLSSLEALKIFEDFSEAKIITHLETASGNIICSPSHFRKCIMNLLLNAVEAATSRPGARVEIATDRLHPDKDIIEKLNLDPGDHMLVRISDNGPGILKEDIGRIFEPFYSRKVLGRSGTGLGLTVVWNIMASCHGGITVDSNKQGTTFTLYVPVTDNAEVESVDDSALWQAQSVRNILVVDDEQQLRDIASRMLTSLGHTARTASSGEEAVFVLQREKFDVVLLDMVMDPGMNGRQTYEEIIKNDANQKALIVSGYSETEDVKQLLALGIGGFINKPFSLAELSLALQKIMPQ
jgi:PAS domain S-box-containing protein